MKISDTVVGAIIALSGVLLTLLSTHVMEWVKSSRERENAGRQRELSLKREVYLPLVQAFTEGMSLFTSIPGAHHSKLSELTLSRQSQNALAAKDLIGSNGVMVAVNSAAKQLAQGMLRLMTLKLDEAKLAIDLENLQTRINSLNSENRLIIDRMQTLRDAGMLNQDMAKGLDTEFQTNDSTLLDLFIQQKDKMDIKNQLMQKMQMQMLKEISELTTASAYAVLAIREDLDIPTDKDQIMDNYRESISFIENSLPGFIDEVWRKVIPERNA
ncbi:MAG: hypothetical protein FIA91_03320 [Geobacter sp.]|nr:hypothetical protein [Geobacter sp.]